MSKATPRMTDVVGGATSWAGIRARSKTTHGIDRGADTITHGRA
jgi:hypothetical protein